jgi:hypothetical protein
MRSFLARRRKRTLVLMVLGVLAIPATAFALWTLTQSTNKFEGKAASTVTLGIINPTSGDLASATQCLPGGSCSILAEVSNPSTAPIQITGYQASAVNGFDDGAVANCAATNFNSTGAESTTFTSLGTPISVPAGAVNQVVTIPNALSMKSTAVPTCAGSTIVESTGNLTVTFTLGS